MSTRKKPSERRAKLIQLSCPVPETVPLSLLKVFRFRIVGLESYFWLDAEFSRVPN